MTTYIVVEVTEKENALDIMNVLMTHSTARFVVTKDIGEYAKEREMLKESADRRATVNKESGNFPNVSNLERSDISNLRIPKEEPGTSDFSFQNFANFNDYTLQKQQEADYAHNESHTGPIRQSNRRLMIRQFACANCGGTIRAIGLDYFKRSNHAIAHTDLCRYICPVTGCGFKGRHRSNIVQHLKQVHPGLPKMSIPDCLSPEDEEKLRMVTFQCFPELAGADVQKRGRRAMKYEENDTTIGDVGDLGDLGDPGQLGDLGEGEDLQLQLQEEHEDEEGGGEEGMDDGGVEEINPDEYQC